MADRQKWEYAALMLKGDLVGGLNKAGQEGWELCEIIEVVKNDEQQIVAHGVLMKRVPQLILTDLTGAPPLKPRGE